MTQRPAGWARHNCARRLGVKYETTVAFDDNQDDLFLWEGVIMYLDRQAVESTLRKIATTAKGSVLVFDYFTIEPLRSRSMYWRFGRAATRAAGEPLCFGIDSTPPSRDRLAELLQSCGLALAEQRTLGPETDGRRAWAGFAVATVATEPVHIVAVVGMRRMPAAPSAPPSHKPRCGSVHRHAVVPRPCGTNWNYPTVPCVSSTCGSR